MRGMSAARETERQRRSQCRSPRRGHRRLPSQLRFTLDLPYSAPIAVTASTGCEDGALTDVVEVRVQMLQWVLKACWLRTCFRLLCQHHASVTQLMQDLQPESAELRRQQPTQHAAREQTAVQVCC
jgi:hypothetical protein